MKYKDSDYSCSAIDRHSPQFQWLLANYEVEANSESEAGNIAFDRFCQENPFRSHRRDDFIITAS